MNRLIALGRRALKWPSDPLPGMGIVVDDESLLHQRNANTLIYRLIYEQKNQYFNRIGVPWYAYELSELLTNAIKFTPKGG